MNIVFSDFKKKKILVIGDVILDRYFYGNITRISQEAPVPIVNIETKDARPGGAANVAMNIVSLGEIKVYLFGVVGTDDSGNVLLDKLKHTNIISSLSIDPSFQTITKLRIFSNNQQLFRLDFEKNNFSRDISNTLLVNIKKILPKVDAIVFSDYKKGVLSKKMFSVINIARKLHIPVLIDPKGIDFSRYYNATLLTPNMSEFESVVGKCLSNKDIEFKGMELIKKLSLKALLITRSELGMVLLQPKQKPFYVPSVAKQVLDVTGAGDTVIAILAVALASKLDFKKSSILANFASGLVVGKLGVSTISSAEFENIFNKNLIKNKYNN